MGFINALNAVSSQVWAFLILIIGGVMVLAFHKAGIAIDIAAGVIGAAVNMFNSLIKPQQPGSSHLEVDSSTTPPGQPSNIMVSAPAGTLGGTPIATPATPMYPVRPAMRS
jgi:hypothetical protein